MGRAPRGFTLIELLVVILIIGVLAVLAVPRFVYTSEKAYIASMKGDSRNLAVAQEAYFFDNSTYHDGPVRSAVLTHDPSRGVSLTLQDVSGTGWAAMANHGATAQQCTIFVGTAPPIAPATVSEEASCG
jgi:prepilin-type N-terminal cleavage/methylation domain-containing protein